MPTQATMGENDFFVIIPPDSGSLEDPCELRLISRGIENTTLALSYGGQPTEYFQWLCMSAARFHGKELYDLVPEVPLKYNKAGVSSHVTDDDMIRLNEVLDR